MDQRIDVKGNLKLTLRDALTHEILQVEEGPNLVLNTGLESLCHLIVGDIKIPTGLNAGDLISESYKSNPYIPLYGQFGTNASVPRPTDASPYFNGTLDQNVVTPFGASEILRAKHFYPSQNSVTVQFVLGPNQGNGIGQEGGVKYREIVLMSKATDSPVTYRWFSRKVFSDIIKTYSTLIEAEWTITFLAG